ncbi:MAG TPA: T9SS type A sorting domain-containing protein, partial [Chitinophagaceae bacterium]|nr:T9SS type A sorting domain-containing protein [Chitinophagaceae bacterium]
VVLSECEGSATITIYVHVTPLPNSGIINGIDSVCSGQVIALTETVAGGVWSSSNFSITTIDSTGIITGVSSGVDTILYTIIDSECTAISIYPFKVLSHSICTAGYNNLSTETHALKIYPNPSFTGQFTIEIYSDREENAQVIISNLIGDIIEKIIAITNTPIKMQLKIPSGVYFLSANISNRKWNEMIIIR